MFLNVGLLYEEVIDLDLRVGNAFYSWQKKNAPNVWQSATAKGII
jgi:hypothetical protein